MLVVVDMNSDTQGRHYNDHRYTKVYIKRFKLKKYIFFKSFSSYRLSIEQSRYYFTIANHANFAFAFGVGVIIKRTESHHMYTPNNQYITYTLTSTIKFPPVGAIAVWSLTR